MRISRLQAAGNGYVVVGDAKGNVRLYNAIDKAAKTKLASVGGKITSVDVTYDGNWVLATTDNYMMLIK